MITSMKIACVHVIHTEVAVMFCFSAYVKYTKIKQRQYFYLFTVLIVTNNFHMYAYCCH